MIIFECSTNVRHKPNKMRHAYQLGEIIIFIIWLATKKNYINGVIVHYPHLLIVINSFVGIVLLKPTFISVKSWNLLTSLNHVTSPLYRVSQYYIPNIGEKSQFYLFSCAFLQNNINFKFLIKQSKIMQNL